MTKKFPPRVGIYLVLPTITLIMVLVETSVSAAGPAETAEAEFFEKRIRPVLVEKCYSCHSAAAQEKGKLRGRLRLDTRAGLRAGGESGPAIVPGKPDESLLLQTLKYDDSIKMPPKGKLPDAVIADFDSWIKSGAVDPRTEAAPVVREPGAIDLEKGRKFWAYRQPAEVKPPAVKATEWAANEVDRFILTALEAKNLKPAPDAPPPVLIRRLYYDLTGLPPTPGEVDAFVHDTDPAAYEKLVDRLLASPQFGERWGRHWLDIARYGESVTLRGFVFKEAWRYRDYVLDSFNRDVPFNRFIREQIAGDLLPAETSADRTRQLVATGYLMLGNTNLEEQDKKQLRMDVVDEQLDVIAKGLLAQTVTCARCHDHKFDPIPTKDYYALAGILRNTQTLEHANVSKWLEAPLPASAEVEAAVKKHAAAIAALQEKIKTAKAKVAPAEQAAKGVLAVKEVPGIVVDDTKAQKVGEWKDSTYSGTYIGGGYTHDLDMGKGQKTITFQPELPASGRYEVWLAYSPGGNRAASVPVTVFSADGEKVFHVDMQKAPPLDGRYISLGQFKCEKDGQSFVLVSNEGTKGVVTADAVTFIPADKVPAPKTGAPGNGALATVTALEAELKKLQADAPKRPLAMAPSEETVIEETRVHIRGNVHTLGEAAPRGFLRVATQVPMPEFPKDQSGRVQLADWIANADNPLTARVYANRAWHWLFGAGIVRTVDNFGSTGELPSNQELLDWLAVKFVRDGWSSKKLVRTLVLSRTYRQASTANEKLVAADPENRLFGRANRRRLEAECLRDAILTVSGKLSAEKGGPGFPANLASDYGFKQTATCRSVYLPVFRNALPELFEVFDFADSSTVTGRRNASTVAPQALFMMNNPFVLEQAKYAAARLLEEPLPDDAARLTHAYRLVLGRPPTDGERAVAARFLTDRAPMDAWASLFHALFASADFRYVE
jgi:cytochrome c553